MSTKFHLGPILALTNATPEKWSISILVVVDETLQPTCSWELDGGVATPIAGRSDFGLSGKKIVYFAFEVSLADSPKKVSYRVEGLDFVFQIPGAGKPPRMAFCSCNGFSDPKLMKDVDDNLERWKALRGTHERTPFNLLLMGGDQVYADSIWEKVDALTKYLERSYARQKSVKWTDSLARQVERFYWNLYLEQWSKAETRAMLAVIPTVMMWDDHDIFDGWGSYPGEMLATPVCRGIFAQARKFFSRFQIQAEPGEFVGESSHFSRVYQLGTIRLLAIDMRSQRTLNHVMSKPIWDDFIEKLEQTPTDTEHLLLMSGIPVVYPDFRMLDGALGLIPGRQELEDDLHDHWRSGRHCKERLRLIHRLLDFSPARKCRVTILSGDVHVAALGVIQSVRKPDVAENANVINQLISSGIVHPPPPAFVAWALRQMSAGMKEEDRDISSRMLNFPGTSECFVARRNWLALSPDATGRIWAEWHFEPDRKGIFGRMFGADETDEEYVKVIHLVS